MVDRGKSIIDDKKVLSARKIIIAVRDSIS